MSEITESLYYKLNALEEFHKACQLTALGLEAPILNESRYLSRALVDYLYFQSRSTEIASKSFERAELAINNGINDALDILVRHVKVALYKIEQSYPKFNIVKSEFGEAYVKALEIIEVLDKMVITSRGDRQNRTDLYTSIVRDSKDSLKQLSNFALMLTRIEAVALIEMERGTENKNSQIEPCELVTNALDSSNLTTNLVFHYHAKYDDNNQCIGSECLVRIMSSGTLIYPNHFIEKAELTGLITRLGFEVFKESMSALKNHPEIPRISINVSPLELLNHEYSKNLLEYLDSVHPDLDRSRIEIEITESMVIEDEASFHHIANLSSAGIKVSLDDFGTGETKFDYLAKVNVDVIKIDRSLLRSYVAAPRSYTKLLQAIASVGKCCDLDVLVEGVEDESELKLMQSLGINKYQGYHWGRPVALDDFIREHSSQFV